jgi:hypothetical protein
MKVVLKKECIPSLEEVLKKSSPVTVDSLNEFQKSISGGVELEVIETVLDNYIVINPRIGLPFAVAQSEVIEFYESNYILLVKNRDSFIKKYNVKLWNGDKCLCYFVRQSETTVTVIANQCGLVEPPVQIEIIVDKKDLIAHCNGEPEVIVICME